jgi:hypothetical protein
VFDQICINIWDMYAFRFLVHKNELTKSSIFDEVV